MAKVYLHSLKDYPNIFKDIKLLKNHESSVEVEKKEDQGTAKKKDEDNTPQSCKVCEYKFTSRIDQVSHYKSDWHRYNIKNNLLNRRSITFKEFEDMIDDLSSISGSDTDYSEDDSMGSKISKIKGFQDDISESKNLNIDPTKITNESMNRSPFFFFKNAQDSTIMVYKVLFSTNEESDYSDILKNFIMSSKNNSCVILFNAGHFAATVFEYGKPIVHKTFHKYVVRAKRGTVQSQRDQKGSAPKSGGASLRRHNESELAKNIQTLLGEWTEEYLNLCTHIFIRSPKYNKAIFYGGKDPVFKKNDQRITGIPFSSRRPTFNETKRVYQELFSVKIYEQGVKIPCKLSPVNKSISTTSAAISEIDFKEISVSNKNEMFDHKINVENEKTLPETKQTQSKTERVPEKKDKVEESENYFKLHQETLLDNLYTACKSGNVKNLASILSSLTIEDKVYLGSTFDVKIDTNGNTLLHVAARSGKRDIIHELLDSGCDPSLKNSDNLTAYSLSCDKPTRNAFRKFMANYPKKYDYVKANIPGPLTEEMELEMKARQNQKKKAKQKVRKEKQKVKAEEQETARLENEAKQKFASMSDREKRALAAEKRIASQAKENGQIPTLTSDRCWKCGESLLGKVPFEYSNFKFCSVSCLKLHKGIKS